MFLRSTYSLSVRPRKENDRSSEQQQQPLGKSFLSATAWSPRPRRRGETRDTTSDASNFNPTRTRRSLDEPIPWAVNNNESDDED